MNAVAPPSVLQRITNTGMRLTTLASKFAVVLGMSVYLPPADVGIYGIVSAAVVLAIYLVGLDYYVFANRRIVGVSVGARSTAIRSQWTLYLLTYGGYCLLVSVGTVTNLIPGQLAIWAILLLLFDHSSQEVNRILIALNDQLFASIVMFLRSGLWGIVALILMITTPSSRNLSYVFTLWATCSCAACVMGFCRLKAKGHLVRTRSEPITALIPGLKVSLPFLLGTAAAWSVLTIDRLMVGWSISLEVVAPYTLFMSASSAIKGFLEAGVYSFSLPRFLVMGKNKCYKDLRRLQTRTLMEVLVVTMLAGAVAVGAGWILVDHWLGPTYRIYFGMLPVILMSTLVYAASVVPYQTLFSLSKDWTIIFSNVACLFVFLVTALCLIPFTSLAVPGGLIAGYGLTFVWRMLAARRELMIGDNDFDKKGGTA